MHAKLASRIVSRLDRDPAHPAHGFGQQVASLVLWFGLDDWVIEQINSEATRTLILSPRCDDNIQQSCVDYSHAVDRDHT